MTYIEGFVTAVPTANRAAYEAHANKAGPMFAGFGATRFVETWGDDVPRGTLNDLWGAVQATDDEAVLFSWIEYPDKATRDAANEKIMADPRMEDMAKDMPFDGKRMIYGGFAAISEAGEDAVTPGYVDGMLVAVPAGQKTAYTDFASRIAAAFRDHGALRVVDAWGDDVSHGERTDYFRATHAEGDEVPVYSWIEWADKPARDAGMAAAMADPRIQPGDAMPFDGKKMIFGGFVPIIDRREDA